MPTDPTRAEAVFLAASEIRDPTDRAKYLDDACAGDADLKARVEALLRAHDQPDSVLDHPIVAPPSPEEAATRAFVPSSQNPDATRTYESQADDDEESLAFLAPAQRPDSLGRIGHYDVLEVLGKGGFGIVFRAFDEVLQRVVAVKVLAPSLATTSPARKRFLREARSSAAVKHENVVQVYAVEDQPLPHLVMEYVPGETLQQRLDRTGPLDVNEVVRIGRQLAEGLAAAHATGLIHRDIKPSNILIDAGPQAVVKITDFGLARAADDASLTRSGVVAGTPMYMAPEQAKGEALDHRADLFSLGSVLYALVSGRPPFRAASTLAVLKRVAEDTPRPIREVIPEVPEWFCRIVEKLHAKDPADRFQSAREVADTLADCEGQLKQHGAIRDFSRIPGGMSPVRRRGFSRAVWKWTSAASLTLFLAVWFGPTAKLYLANQGELEIQPGEGLMSVIVLQNDEGIIDGDKLHAPVTDWLGMKQSHTLKLPPGKYQVNVGTWPAGTTVREWDVTTSGAFGKSRLAVPVVSTSAIVTVTRGQVVTLRPQIVAAPPSQPVPVSAPDGWVQLFNGKDLTGWKMHPNEKDRRWDVEDGELFLAGPSDSHLFSDRADFLNVHVRIEAKCQASARATVGLRAPFAIEDWGGVRCVGAGLGRHAGNIFFGFEKNVVPKETPVEDDVWFTQEVILNGKEVVTKLNGVVVSTLTSPPSEFPPGHVVLTLPPNRVRIRKVEIKELPPSPPASAEFVSLFNGKDLTGWKTHSLDQAKWRVEGGAIVSPPSGHSYLFTDRGDFENFHLRAEARINPTGDAGIVFRTDFAVNATPNGVSYRSGYEAQIGVRSNWKVHTGSLSWPLGTTASEGVLQVAPVNSHRPDEWFVLEVIAEGSRIRTRVNGQDTVDFRDEKRQFLRGHLALQTWGVNSTQVQFRKIEIKELPPSHPPATGFFPLFNGKDLTGWTPILHNPQWGVTGGSWTVADGILTGRGPQSYLWTDRRDFTDFHLRAEVRLANGNSGLYFRSRDRNRTGYEADVCPPGGERPTGTVRRDADGKLMAAAALPPPPTGRWFTLEVTARGQSVRVQIDGREVATFADATDLHGGFGLQAMSAGTDTGLVEFRKIEIRETSPSVVEPRPMRPIALNWPSKVAEWVDPTGQCKVTAKGDHCEFTVPGDKPLNLNPAPGYNLDAPRWTWAADGDFTYQVTVRDFPRPKPGTSSRGPSGYSYRGAGFVVWADEKSFVRFERAGLGETEDGRPYYHLEAFADGRRTLDLPTWLDGPDGHLRVERRGNTLLFSSSPDGTRWQEWKKIDTLPMQKGVRVGLVAVNSTNETFRPVFANLATAGAADSKWTPLFNGKDLTGWNTHAAAPGKWTVENGVLKGNYRVGFLFTERDDFANFHLRAEVRVNAGGDANLLFRCPFEVIKVGPQLAYFGVPNCYLTWLQRVKRLQAPTAGSVGRAGQAVGAGLSMLGFATDGLIPPGEWATVEVIADGNRFVTTVNGKDAVNCSDPLKAHARGRIGFSCYTESTVVEVRKVEVQHLPPTPEPDRLGQALLDKVTARQKELDAAKARFAAQTVPASAVTVAEIPLLEAKLELAEARRQDAEAIRLSRDVVAKLEEKRKYTAERVTAGVLLADALDPIDAEIATANARLAKARLKEPPSAVAPFDAATATAHQDAWAKHLGRPLEVTNAVGMTFRLIPPGEFQMGSPDGEKDRLSDREGPRHRVVIPTPFHLGREEVTQEQFRLVMGKTPSHFTAKNGGGPDYPVESVSYEDAQEFCRLLSAKATEKTAGRTYRLPTEAEWEYACRAGTTTAFAHGDDPKGLDEYAWHKSNADGTQSVGRRKPNPWGLYDLHGNVFELCADRHNYKTGKSEAAPGEVVTSRGGSWMKPAADARSGFRGENGPKAKHKDVGFRVVCEQSDPSGR